MNEKRIKITYLPLFIVIIWKRKMIVIRFIKGFLKPTKQGCHRKIHASMAKIDGRIDQRRLGILIAHKISTPEIAMKQGRPFVIKDVSQSLVKIFKCIKMSGEE